jgi:hypothetical protein
MAEPANDPLDAPRANQKIDEDEGDAEEGGVEEGHLSP